MLRVLVRRSRVATVAGLFALAVATSATMGVSTAAASCTFKSYSRGPSNDNSPNVQKPADSCVDLNQAADITDHFVGFLGTSSSGPWYAGSAGCNPIVYANSGYTVLVSSIATGTWMHSDTCYGLVTFNGTLEY